METDTQRRPRPTEQSTTISRENRTIVTDETIFLGNICTADKANQQPWPFVAVSDERTKMRIRVAAEREEELLYRERAGEEYLDAIRPIGTNWIKPHLTDAPYLIAVFEQPWRLEDGEKRKHYYVRESVGIAVGFLLSALHDAGLATLTHAPSPMGFLNDILERPSHERPFILVPVGYPAPSAEVPRLSKKTLDAIATFV